MRFLYRHLLAVVVGLGLSAVAIASTTYVVKKGDTLSEIAASVLKGHVWGSHGSLKRVLALNTQIKNPHWIYPGQKINLPGRETVAIKKQSHRKRAPASTSASEEVQGDPSGSWNPKKYSLGTPIGSFEVLPTFEFSHLNVTDSTTKTQASIYSSSVIGADLKWNHFFSPQNTGYFQAGFRHYSLIQPSSVGTLSSPNPTTWNFEVGEEHRFTEHFSGSADLGYGQVLSLSGLNSTTLSVDLVRVPRLGVGGRYILSGSEDFEFGVKGGASLLFPGNSVNYQSKFGSTESLSLYGTDHTFLARFGVSLTNFSTSFSTVQQLDFEFQLGVSFDIFSKKAKKAE